MLMLSMMQVIAAEGEHKASRSLSFCLSINHWKSLFDKNKQITEDDLIWRRCAGLWGWRLRWSWTVPPLCRCWLMISEILFFVFYSSMSFFLNLWLCLGFGQTLIMTFSLVVNFCLGFKRKGAAIGDIKFPFTAEVPANLEQHISRTQQHGWSNMIKKIAPNIPHGPFKMTWLSRQTWESVFFRLSSPSPLI